MTGTEHKTIAVGPQWLSRIVAQRCGPQLKRDRRQGHRRPWVATLGSLNPIHTEGANRVDGQFFNRGVSDDRG